MLPQATENAVAGHIWPVGRYLPTPVLDDSFGCNNSCNLQIKKHSLCLNENNGVETRKIMEIRLLEHTEVTKTLLIYQHQQLLRLLIPIPYGY